MRVVHALAVDDVDKTACGIEWEPGILAGTPMFGRAWLEATAIRKGLTLCSSCAEKMPQRRMAPTRTMPS